MIKKLLDSPVGSVYHMYGGYGDTKTMYCFVKFNREVKGYRLRSLLPLQPFVSITKHRIKFVATNNFDVYSLCSLLLAYLKPFNNWKIHWLRGCCMMKTPRAHFACIFSFTLDWEGNLIKPSKVIKEKTKKILEEDKEIRNRNARARYHDNKAEERYKAAAGNLDLIPVGDVFKTRNVTRRTKLIEHFSLTEIVKTLPHKLVSEDKINGQLYRLLNVKIPDVEGEEGCLYLEMTNPSTGEHCLEGVDNNITPTCRNALAWRDGESTYVEPTILT